LNGTVNQKKITLLGWAFKKDTNDSRESAAIYVADTLLDEGAEVHVFDPMVKIDRIHQDLTNLWEGRNESEQKIESKLKRLVVHQEHSVALECSFAAGILTEWDEFKSYNWNAIADKMIQPAKIFDGRNILETSKGYKNINVSSIGK
ncbi:MAG: UDP binding domain-containing protein, partial [Flavobacteriales bacterium]